MNRLRWTGPAATGFRPAWIVVLVSFLTCIAVSASAQRAYEITGELARTDVEQPTGVEPERARDKVRELRDITAGAGYVGKAMLGGGLCGGIANREDRDVAHRGCLRQRARAIGAGKEYRLNARQRHINLWQMANFEQGHQHDVVTATFKFNSQRRGIIARSHHKDPHGPLTRSRTIQAPRHRVKRPQPRRPTRPHQRPNLDASGGGGRCHQTSQPSLPG